MVKRKQAHAIFTPHPAPRRRARAISSLFSRHSYYGMMKSDLYKMSVVRTGAAFYLAEMNRLLDRSVDFNKTAKDILKALNKKPVADGFNHAQSGKDADSAEIRKQMIALRQRIVEVSIEKSGAQNIERLSAVA